MVLLSQYWNAAREKYIGHYGSRDLYVAYKYVDTIDSLPLYIYIYIFVEVLRWYTTFTLYYRSFTVNLFFVAS